MLRAFLVTLALAALVAALPAASIAQDAGSNQYQDPLAGEPSGDGGGNGGGGGGGGNGNAPSNTQDVQSQADADTNSAATPAREQLPATGSETGLLALAGVMLLGGGLGLRRVAGRPSV